MAYIAPVAPNAITPHTFTEAPLELLKRGYSDEEVFVAVGLAKARWLQHTFNDPVDLITAWHVVHVLTSDDAWNASQDYSKEPPRLHETWTFEVGVFVKNLLLATQPLPLGGHTMANFIVENLDHADDMGFLRLIRAYYFAFPQTLNTFAHHMPDEPLGSGDYECSYNPIHLAAAGAMIPVRVLETIMQAGAVVDAAINTGHTPLMLAIANIGGSYPEKVKLLLDYGADIGVFDTLFATPLHLAALHGNVDGVRLILRERETFYKKSPARHVGQALFKERLYIDPLYMQDSDHETALMVATGNIRMKQGDREEMVKLLLPSGYDTDASSMERDADMLVVVDLDSVDRLCYGIITCHERQGDGEDGTFVLHVSIRKDAYNVDIWMDSALAEEFLVEDQGCTFPPGGMSRYDIEEVFRGCHGQRFDFYDGACYADDISIDGLDFNLFFKVVDTSTDKDGHIIYETQILLESAMDEIDSDTYCMFPMRFPRGPCPMHFWTHDAPGEPSFKSRITMHQHMSLLHHAVMCEHTQVRRQMMHYGRRVCNPLLRCDKGFTALELLGKTLATRRKRDGSDQHTEDETFMFDTMLKDHDEMLTWIYRDALLLGATTKKLAAIEGDTNTDPLVTSPFHQLPDDVCRSILDYI
ncbi:ankyrin repeat-containing domain protein [Baffinella frigidus]|nr:ankyrin repeat-containing domain protein [Cryptophyta sp. CCMP2293]